jgi:hypothetical protein
LPSWNAVSDSSRADMLMDPWKATHPGADPNFRDVSAILASASNELRFGRSTTSNEIEMESLVVQAEGAMKAGHLMEAATMLQQALRNNPDDAQARDRLRAGLADAASRGGIAPVVRSTPRHLRLAERPSGRMGRWSTWPLANARVHFWCIGRPSAGIPHYLRAMCCNARVCCCIQR